MNAADAATDDVLERGLGRCPVCATWGGEPASLNVGFSGRRCAKCGTIETIHDSAGSDEVNIRNYPLAARLALYQSRWREFDSR